MSAFIVQPLTMSRALRALQIAEGTNPPCEQLDQEGRELYRLNLDAVNARYGRGETEPLTETFAYSVIFPPKVQCYKALLCLIYQCSEGRIPERPLYQRLINASHKLAREIVCDLEEYDDAQWD